MPIYEYQCRCGKKTEEFHKINRIPNKTRCSCGWMAKKVLSRGAILPDGDVSWLESAKANLPNDAKYIETRSEHKRYLKEHHLECVG